MAVNVVREYKKLYIEGRRRGSDMDNAHSEAVKEIGWQLLKYSSAYTVPISKREMAILNDLEENPHFRLLLEDILDKNEEEQKAYLQAAAKVPQLRLVK